MSSRPDSPKEGFLPKLNQLKPRRAPDATPASKRHAAKVAGALTGPLPPIFQTPKQAPDLGQQISRGSSIDGQVFWSEESVKIVPFKERSLTPQDFEQQKQWLSSIEGRKPTSVLIDLKMNMTGAYPLTMGVNLYRWRRCDSQLRRYFENLVSKIDIKGDLKRLLQQTDAREGCFNDLVVQVLGGIGTQIKALKGEDDNHPSHEKRLINRSLRTLLKCITDFSVAYKLIAIKTGSKEKALGQLIQQLKAVINKENLQEKIELLNECKDFLPKIPNYENVFKATKMVKGALQQVLAERREAEQWYKNFEILAQKVPGVTVKIKNSILTDGVEMQWLDGLLSGETQMTQTTRSDASEESVVGESPCTYFPESLRTVVPAFDSLKESAAEKWDALRTACPTDSDIQEKLRAANEAFGAYKAVLLDEITTRMEGPLLLSDVDQVVSLIHTYQNVWPVAQFFRFCLLDPKIFFEIKEY